MIKDPIYIRCDGCGTRKACGLVIIKDGFAMYCESCQSKPSIN